MKNFAITDKTTGREYWISRSVAVVAFIWAVEYNENKILAVQRGTGTPDPEYIGKWCLPCGYLDFDETIEEAISREVFEETGLTIDPEDFNMLYIKSDPKSDKRQNVTIGLESFNDLELYGEPTFENSEPNEVAAVKWIPIKDIDNYEWAFNHLELIKQWY